jgi:hypothetical protein
MSRLFLILLVLVALTFAACSYPIELVVINESDQPLEVQLRFFYATDNSDLPISVGELATASAERVLAGDKDWRRLSEAEYRLDRESRTVAAKVMPGDALLIQKVHDNAVQDGELLYFGVEEIRMTGAYGSFCLEGVQLRKNFVPESRRVYVLAYK